MAKRVLRVVLIGVASAILIGAEQAVGETSQTKELVIRAMPSAGGELHPGARVDLRVAVTNPNRAVVRISTFVLADPITSEDERLCRGAAYVTFARSTVGATTIGAHATGTVVLEGALSMSPDAPQGCAGRAFTIPLLVR